MTSVARMLQRMSVAATAAILLPAAAERAAGEAKPQVRGETAIGVGAEGEACRI